VKKIYSLSFFRHPASAYESPRCGASQGRFFANFLPVVIRAFRSIFKPAGWTLRIHHDPKACEFQYYEALVAFEAAGILELQMMGQAETLCGSMLWRMRPAWDNGVSRLVCRDLDSLPTVRELNALKRWEESGVPVSALHDSQSHSATALMGGMIGLRPFTPIADQWIGRSWGEFTALQLKSGIDFNQHGSDQQFLNGLPNRPPVLSENRESMGPRTDPRDQLSAHIGGAFHALPAQQWYDANMPDDEILKIEKEVLK
jgi:hypothetical protein